MVFFLPSFIDLRAPLWQRRKHINTINGTIEQQKSIAHINAYINDLIRIIQNEAEIGAKLDEAILQLKHAARATRLAILDQPKPLTKDAVRRHTPACIAKMRGRLKPTCPGCK